MSWAVGRDPYRLRHIGYGVPAGCDYPGCTVSIDRGMAYACAEGMFGPYSELSCGLFFCYHHRSDPIYVGGVYRTDGCERCARGMAPLTASSDVLEWVEHVLTDESWEQFRAEEAAWTELYRMRYEELTG